MTSRTIRRVGSAALERRRELTTELATLALQQVRDDPTQPDPARPLTGLFARALSRGYRGAPSTGTDRRKEDGGSLGPACSAC